MTSTRRLFRTLLVAAMLAAALATATAQPAAAHEGNYPVVLIPGWHGDGSIFDELIPLLEAQGITVIDFDQSTAGTQALHYAPSASGQHISYVAGELVEEQIVAALDANGYDGDTQKIDIVAHSMGGLVSRFLVEQPGADVEYWSTSTGWYGDGTADVATDWASRVDDLVMAGTPNHGTWEGWIPGTIGGFGDWNETGGDMAPNSRFLTEMGYAEPSGEDYTTIGGDPWYLQWLQFDYNGDSQSHGFDGVVPAESPFLTGSEQILSPGHHGELVTEDTAVDAIIGALGYTSTQTGTGDAHLAGSASIKLEYADIVSDYDPGSNDEYRFDVWVDLDGNNDGYTYASTIAYDRDGPFTQNWGNSGPAASTLTLPGTSPRIDVKVVVWEDDPGGDDSVSTVYFHDVMLSDDLDGQDHYEATAANAMGGTNTFRISLNGATSAPGQTRLVSFGFDKAWIQDDLDWGAGEVQFTIHAGRDGYAGEYYRGSPTDGSHYSRNNNSWVDIGTHAKNNSVVESETVWEGRILSGTNWRFDVEYWEDDGGWSNRDHGGTYVWTGAVDSLNSGRTNYSATSDSDFDVWWYLDAD